MTTTRWVGERAMTRHLRFQSAWIKSIFCVLAVASLAGCESEYPGEFRGNRISGTMRFEAGVGKDLSDEVLAVMAVTELDLTTIFPHNLKVFAEPQFPVEGIPYELSHVLPYAYYVLAVIMPKDTVEDTLPKFLGAYPDFCTVVGGTDLGKVTVTEDEPAQGIDIVLYGGMGMQDPCLTNP